MPTTHLALFNAQCGTWPCPAWTPPCCTATACLEPTRRCMRKARDSGTTRCAPASSGVLQGRRGYCKAEAVPGWDVGWQHTKSGGTLAMWGASGAGRTLPTSRFMQALLPLSLPRPRPPALASIRRRSIPLSAVSPALSCIHCRSVPPCSPLMTAPLRPSLPQARVVLDPYAKVILNGRRHFGEMGPVRGAASCCPVLPCCAAASTPRCLPACLPACLLHHCVAARCRAACHCCLSPARSPARPPAGPSQPCFAPNRTCPMAPRGCWAWQPRGRRRRRRCRSPPAAKSSTGRGTGRWASQWRTW